MPPYALCALDPDANFKGRGHSFDLSHRQSRRSECNERGPKNEGSYQTNPSHSCRAGYTEKGLTCLSKPFFRALVDSFPRHCTSHRSCKRQVAILLLSANRLRSASASPGASTTVSKISTSESSLARMGTAVSLKVTN